MMGKGEKLNQKVWKLFAKAGFKTKPNEGDPKEEKIPLDGRKSRTVDLCAWDDDLGIKIIGWNKARKDLTESFSVHFHDYEKLKDDGSICWQVGNYIENGEVVPLDIKFYEIFKSFGFKLRNRVIWHYRHGLHASKKFSGRYETLLWFTKSDDYTFNLDSIRIPSKYPGKTYYKGNKKGKPSGNPNGKNSSDVWEVILNDWDSLFWDIPNVKANHPEKTIQPCQFPVELVERCILALTNPREWVLDPFVGVGSTLIAAAKTNRKSLGSEKEKKYYELANDRLKKLKTGKLKIRPIGKPIHEPNGKVARVPEEWKK